MVFSKRMGSDSSCMRGTIQRVGRDFVDICHNGKVTSIRIKDISKVDWLNCNTCENTDESSSSSFCESSSWPLPVESSSSQWESSSCPIPPVESSSSCPESSSIQPIESSCHCRNHRKPLPQPFGRHHRPPHPPESSSFPHHRYSYSTPESSIFRQRLQSAGSGHPVQLSTSESVAINNLNNFESHPWPWESQQNSIESSSHLNEPSSLDTMLRRHVGGLVQICVCRSH